MTFLQVPRQLSRVRATSDGPLVTLAPSLQRETGLIDFKVQ